MQSSAFSPDGRRVVLGDSLGQVLLLFVENLDVSPAIITPYLKSDELFFPCHYCQEKNKIEEPSLGQEISCSFCNKTVKLNPSTVNLD